MHFTRAAAIAAFTTAASAASSIRGFNTGSTFADGSGKMQSDFQSEFSNQKKIDGTNGAFNSVRLYTMIQGGTTADPISAIPAAIAEGTGLLLGLWASAGQDSFNDEITALSAAISQYGTAFTSLVQGISVGSEDLYRISPTGIANSAGVGAGPDTLASYISMVRKTIAGTALSGAKVGHVDTWNSWTNSSNSAVIDACDFLGVDEYPYYQSVNTNPIGNAQSLFYQAVEATQNVGGGKPVWITESGWPITGATVGEAVASVANARQYWLDVYCTLPADTPVYWYIQFDPSDPADFGITGTSLSTTPVYPLNCNGATPYNPSSASSSSSSTSSTSTAASSTHTSKTSATSATATSGGSVGSSSSSTTKATSGAGSSVTATGSGSSTTATRAASSTTVTGGSGQIIGATTLTSVTSPSASATPSAAVNSGSNTQIYTLALLIVPALLALLA